MAHPLLVTSDIPTTSNMLDLLSYSCSMAPGGGRGGEGGGGVTKGNFIFYQLLKVHLYSVAWSTNMWLYYCVIKVWWPNATRFRLFVSFHFHTSKLIKSIPFRFTVGLPHRFFALWMASTGMPSRDLNPGEPNRWRATNWATPYPTLSYTPYPTEIRRTLNWATPNPTWAAPHPIWAAPHPIWATPYPKVTKLCLSILKTRIPHGPLQFFAKSLTKTLFYYLVLADDVSFEQGKLKGYHCSKVDLSLLLIFKLSQYHYNHTYLYICIIQLCRMDGVKGDGAGKFLRQNVQLNTAP